MLQSIVNDFSFLWGKEQKFTSSTTQHYCSIFHFAISCTKSRLHSTVLPSWDNRAMLEKHKSFKMNGGFKKLCFYQPWAQEVCEWQAFCSVSLFRILWNICLCKLGIVIFFHAFHYNGKVHVRSVSFFNLFCQKYLGFC